MEKDLGTSEPLLDSYDADREHSSEEDLTTPVGARVPKPGFRAKAKRVLFYQTLFNLALVFLGLYIYSSRKASKNPIFPQLLYSPVQDVLQYKVQKYFGGFGNDKSIFQGPPSPELDAAWFELERHGIVTVPKEQAAQMPYKTRPISGQPDHYVTQIDVFHQLHCLNAVRMAHHRPYYENSPHFLSEYGPPGDPKTDAALLKHLEHCIEGLRQSIMCSSDISPIVWLWTGEETGAMPSGSIVHTCRDWDRVSEWARERVINDTLYDPHVKVLDPLQGEI